MKTESEILNEINELKVDIWGNPSLKGKTTQQGDCEYCGRKTGKNPLFVHVTTAGICLPNTITEDDLDIVGMESQECWAIGSNCAKKLFGKKIELYTRKFQNA